MKLFKEEQAVLDKLLEEWYEGIKAFQEKCDGMFSEKAQLYDKTSPVWERIEFPMGFHQELRKKIDRVNQLLEPYKSGGYDAVNWAEVLEELMDLTNYPAMFASLIRMMGSQQ